MGIGTSGSLTQRTRLAILLLYVAGLLIASKLSLDTWLPPTTEKGVWFYSALAALLLGNLLVTPFFTKPADSISYAVACIVALLAVNVWSSNQVTGFDQFTWSIAFTYATLVLVSAIVSIGLQHSENPITQRTSKSLFMLCDSFGQPRVIFSVVFLFALLTYHRNNPREYLIIGISWAIFVGLRPLEEIANLLRRWGDIWISDDRFPRMGEIVGHETPNIVLVREDEGQEVVFGEVLITRSDDGHSSYALALDHVGFADGRWLRAIHLCRVGDQGCASTADGSAYLVCQDANSNNPTHPLLQAREHLLGLVAPQTTVGRLNFEIVRADLAVDQGSLVEASIGCQKVFYQVIDGVTHEEILHQKNKRGFVCVSAKKIGTWNGDQSRFDNVPWLPQPNEPVLLVPREESIIDRGMVGHFPGTPYPISVDLNSLVIHNAAILGILGVGKSFLALELVERMIDAGIKIICLDLTNQYASELEPFYKKELEMATLQELTNIGGSGKTKSSRNVEEGGSITDFTSKVKEHLRVFLAENSSDNLKIFNPARFEVWRQDSKQYPDGNAAMTMLTPCEVTRIITEATLEILQAQGMTDKAKCCLVYEEAHSLIPEWNAIASEGDRGATNGTAKAILQGRKFGLGCLVITQRTANVTKSILNQCNTVFALRVFDATGMEFLKNYIGDDYAGVLSNLEDRHAVIFGRASSCRDPVLARLNDRDKFLAMFRNTQPDWNTKETQE